MKASSPDYFWNAIQNIYGEIPRLIKLVLQTNGFDSFLALKGIRYDDKNEFFSSLELTILEILNSDTDSLDKSDLEVEVSAQYQNATNFRLKPGHRNFIMNLMFEIEKTDVHEFFDKSEEFRIRSDSSADSHKKEKIDHEYSRDDQEQQEDDALFEEYLTDDTTYDYVVEDQLEAVNNKPKRMKYWTSMNTQDAVSLPSSSLKRKPDHMYNAQFIAKCANPRRRRVASSKNYPDTEDGTRERFKDLIQQVSSKLLLLLLMILIFSFQF